MKEDIAVELDAVTEDIRTLIGSPVLMAKATAAQLDSVPQTLLANLKTLTSIDVAELKKMTHRLKGFSAENLESFLGQIPDEKFREMIKTLGCGTNWSGPQLNALVNKARLALGKVSEIQRHWPIFKASSN